MRSLVNLYFWATDWAVPNVNPNYFTVLRLVFAVMTFTLLWQWGLSRGSEGYWLPWLALGSWLGGYFTDHWDGRIARKHGWITRFGEEFDPYADAVNCLGVYAGFYTAGILKADALWMLVAVIFRDLTTNFLRSRAKHLGERLPARKSGKIKAVLQWIGSMAIFMVILGLGNYDWTQAICWWIMLVVSSYTVFSGIEYTWACRHFFYGEFNWQKPPHAETPRQKRDSGPVVAK